MSKGIDWDEYNAWNESPAADSAPYVVHSAGPDDVFMARTWREAVEIAMGINAVTLEYVRRTKHDGLVRSWATPYPRP